MRPADEAGAGRPPEVISGPRLWLNGKVRAAVHAAWIPVLGWTLAVAGAIAAIPQIIHMIRTRRVEGLSPTTELLWLPSYALWLWYVIDLGLAPRALAEGLGLIVSAGTVTLLLAGLARTGAAWAAVRAATPLVVTCIVGVLAARWLWGLDGMGVAVTLVDLVALGPLLRTTMTAPSLAGVSVWAWVAKLSTYLGWIAYALAVHEPLSAGWMYLMVPVSLFMLVRLAADRGLAVRLRTGRRTAAARLLRRRPAAARTP